MRQITPRLFAWVCFCVLMENGSGVLDKHLDYIAEKTNMVSENLHAFRRLDIHNMRKVQLWCETWGVDMPDECAEILERSEKALAEMENKGYHL